MTSKISDQKVHDSMISWGTSLTVDFHRFGSPRFADFYIVAVGQELELHGSPGWIRWIRNSSDGWDLRQKLDSDHFTIAAYTIGIYEYLYVFICIYHNFPYNFHEQILCHLLSILGSASYFPGLRPLVACAWCRSPWTRRWHSKGLEGRLSLPQPGGAKMEAAALRHFCGCPARGWDSWINCTVGHRLWNDNSQPVSL